jgi:putative FmdB family regulatory protein
MPIYEYRCRECGEVTEALVPMGGKPDVACAKCGSKKTERKFSTFGTGGASAGASGPGCSSFT